MRGVTTFHRILESVSRCGQSRGMILPKLCQLLLFPPLLSTLCFWSFPHRKHNLAIVPDNFAHQETLAQNESSQNQTLLGSQEQILTIHSAHLNEHTILLPFKPVNDMLSVCPRNLSRL